jgi:hypothetical protein
MLAAPPFAEVIVTVVPEIEYVPESLVVGELELTLQLQFDPDVVQLEVSPPSSAFAAIPN